jgi:hypothetical protein
MKNRMREIRTSGSVRDGDGDIPVYSARDFDNTARGAVFFIERSKSRIGIRLQKARPGAEMAARMFAAAIGRVEIGGGWRRISAKGLVVAGINP